MGGPRDKVAIAPNLNASANLSGLYRRLLSLSQGPALLYASASWEGTAESGANKPTATGDYRNSDPVSGYMNVSACIGNFINPPVAGWPLVADEDLHVFAHAEGGIEEVEFWCEGNGAVIREPSVRTIAYGGRMGKLPLYSVRLSYGSFPSDGAFAVYATLKAKDPGIADRVIGPMMYRRKTGDAFKKVEVRQTGTDVEGALYCGPTALLKARNWYAAQSTFPDVWLYANTPFVHDHAIGGTWTTVADRGTLLVKPDVGGSITINAASIPFDQPALANVDFKTNGLVWDGATFDMTRIVNMTKDPTVNPVIMKGCRVNGAGRAEMFGSKGVLSGTNADRQARVSSPITTNTHMFYGCMFTDATGIGRTCTRSVLTTFDGISQDIHSPGNGNGMVALFLDIRNHICSDLKEPIDYLSLSHNGAGGTATYEVSGSPNTGSRKVVLYLNGVEVQRVTASVVAGAAPYSFSDAAAVINAQTGTHGVTAVALADTYRFALIGGNSTTLPTPISTVSASPTLVKAWIDVHQDLFQNNDDTNTDNVIIYGYRTGNVDALAQQMFFKNLNGTAHNTLFANNAGTSGSSEDGGIIFKSQLWATFKHLQVLNNSIPNQDLLIRDPITSFDTFSRVSANVFASLIVTNISPTQGRFTDNHWINGVQGTSRALWRDDGAMIARNTQGGLVSLLFQSWGDLKLLPAGLLLAGLTQRFMQADINGNERTSITFKGAVGTLF